MRMFVVIFAALLVAGGSGFYLWSALRPEAPQVVAAEPVEAPRSVQVYVPAAPLAAGTLLRPESLARMSLPDDAVTEEMVIADEAGLQDLVGSVARQGLAKGVPIARSAVVKPGDRGFLAAVLPQGKRAISIPISETAGLYGLVMPGDRVDIILTYSVAGSVIDVGRDIKASETVLTNLRVLALDQRLQPGQTMAEQVNPTEMRPVARTATLEVTPQEAEMLTLANQLGALSLVLNSIQDGGDVSDLPAGPDGLAEGPAPGKRVLQSRAPERRALTLDSEVTSLLKREAALIGGLAPGGDGLPDGQRLTPIPERITRVQVVRGIATNALRFSAGEGEAAAGIAPDLVGAAAAAPADAAVTLVPVND